MRDVVRFLYTIMLPQLLLNIFDNSTAGIRGRLYWTEINLSVMKVNLREKMVEAYSESPSATQTVGIQTKAIRIVIYMIGVEGNCKPVGKH